MTLADREKRLGEWLYARRGWLPPAVWGLSALALLLSRPFWITPDSLWLDIPCLVAILAGVTIRTLCLGYFQPGVLQTRGLYAVVRHPRELGGGLVALGVICYTGIFGWSLLGMALYGWALEKILLARERRLLAADRSAYRAYAGRTPPLQPRWRQWTAPGIPFQSARALRRGARELTVTLLGILLLSLLKSRLVDFAWSIDRFWAWALGGALLLGLAARMIPRPRTLP